jgi:hypothetical protein
MKSQLLSVLRFAVLGAAAAVIGTGLSILFSPAAASLACDLPSTPPRLPIGLSAISHPISVPPSVPTLIMSIAEAISPSASAPEASGVAVRAQPSVPATPISGVATTSLGSLDLGHLVTAVNPSKIVNSGPIKGIYTAGTGILGLSQSPVDTSTPPVPSRPSRAPSTVGPELSDSPASLRPSSAIIRAPLNAVQTFPNRQPAGAPSNQPAGNRPRKPSLLEGFSGFSGFLGASGRGSASSPLSVIRSVDRAAPPKIQPNGGGRPTSSAASAPLKEIGTTPG